MSSNDIYMRQSGFIPPEYLSDLRITIIGCGNLGSITAITLAKMGIRRFNIIDNDSIEIHNLPNQWYTNDSVGSLKTEALYQEIHSFHPQRSGLYIKCDSTHFGILHMNYSPDIVIMAIDSTRGRKNILEIIKFWYKKTKKNITVIDVGTNQLVGRITVFNTSDEKAFSTHYAQVNEWLKTPDERVCGRSAIMFVGEFIATMVGTVVYKLANNVEVPFQRIFDVNQMFEYQFTLPEPLKIRNVPEKVINNYYEQLVEIIKNGMEDYEMFIFLRHVALNRKLVEITKGIEITLDRKCKIYGKDIFEESCFSCLCRTCKKQDDDCPIKRCESCITGDGFSFVKRCIHYSYDDEILGREDDLSRAEKMVLSSFGTLKKSEIITLEKSIVGEL